MWNFLIFLSLISYLNPNAPELINFHQSNFHKQFLWQTFFLEQNFSTHRPTIWNFAIFEILRKREKIFATIGRWWVGYFESTTFYGWRGFRDVDNCVRFIGDFHVIARGPNFIYTRRKIGARYYLDLLQSELEFPLQMRLACQRIFQCELQRSRFVELKYLNM